ncbi:MAG: right-handed parallel beta-helix repeat-containing protein [Bacteroidales bacterium]|nr:right-handed parallel beta-helix repeat-containing protein [Candidatus Latescibacterota bacterium]
MRAICFSVLILMLVSAICPSAVVSANLVVHQNGSGDFVTINEAVASANPNDTITIGPGTYYELIEPVFFLYYISEAGPETTILDGEDSHRQFVFYAGSGGSIEGFTLRNGFGTNGGAVYMREGVEVSLTGCVVEENNASFDGGGFFGRMGSSMTLADCTFRNNWADHNGGAGILIENGHLEVTGCVLYQNSCDLIGGGLTILDGTMGLTDCLFYNNASDDVCGAVLFDRSSGIVTGCTIVGNTSSGIEAASLFALSSSSHVTVTNSIVSGETAGYGIYALWGAEIVSSCNILWDNSRGNYAGFTLDATDMMVDPVFCEPVSHDYSIAYESPAAGNNLCEVLIGSEEPACNLDIISPEPAIMSITDIPDDQGNQVRIVWNRSMHDSQGSEETIEGYAIYRKEDGYPLAFDNDLSAPDERPLMRGAALAGWDYVMTVPARGDDVYQAVVPTLCNFSRKTGICWSHFFISALTPDPLEYWDSEIDSGYSIDNIAPVRPKGFIGDQVAGGMRLRWEENSDLDLAFYRLYRIDAGSDPSARVLVSETSLMEFTDSEWVPGCMSTYELFAVDINSNVSEAVLLSEMVDEESPFIDPTLFQNYPNPFNPSTTLKFYLPEASGITLDIYDVTGRHISRLFEGVRSPGMHTLEWDGSDSKGNRVSSGVYIYRLVTGKGILAKKMLMLR